MQILGFPGQSHKSSCLLLLTQLSGCLQGQIAGTSAMGTSGAQNFTGQDDFRTILGSPERLAEAAGWVLFLSALCWVFTEGMAGEHGP